MAPSLPCANPSLLAKYYAGPATPGAISPPGGSDFNVNSIPTGGWNLVPHQRVVGPTIRIGVIAFHVEGIARVRFGCHQVSLSSFVDVTETSINPTTGCPEYWFELDLAGGSYDTVQLYGFDAIIEPVYGVPISLERLFLYVDKNDSFVPEVRYVATTGSDSNPGTEGSPFQTVRKAFSDVSLVDGAEVILLNNNVQAGTASVAAMANHWPILKGDPNSSWGSIRWTDWDNLNYGKTAFSTSGTGTGAISSPSGPAAVFDATDVGDWTSTGARVGRLLRVTSGSQQSEYEIIEVSVGSLKIRSYSQDALSPESSLNWVVIGGQGFLRGIKVERIQTYYIQAGQVFPNKGTMVWVNDCDVYNSSNPFVLGDSPTLTNAAHRWLGDSFGEDQSFHTNNQVHEIDWGLGDSTRYLFGCSIWRIADSVTQYPHYPVLAVANWIQDVHDDTGGTGGRANTIFHFESSASSSSSGIYENITYAYNKIVFSAGDEAVSTDHCHFIDSGFFSGEEAERFRGLSVVGNIFENADRATPNAGGYSVLFRMAQPISGTHGSWTFHHNTLVRQAILIESGGSSPAASSDIENLSFKNNIFEKGVTFTLQPSDGSWKFSNNHYGVGSTHSDMKATSSDREILLFGATPVLNNHFVPLDGSKADGVYRDATLGFLVEPTVTHQILGDTDQPSSYQELGAIAGGIGRSGLDFVPVGSQPHLGGAGRVSSPELSTTMTQVNEVTGSVDISGDLVASVSQLSAVTGSLSLLLSSSVSQSSSLQGGTALTSGDWYSSSWRKRLILDVNNPSFVVGSSKSDFLFLVRLTGDNATVNADLSSTLAQGNTIVATLDPFAGELPATTVSQSNEITGTVTEPSSATILSPGGGFGGPTTPPGQGNSGPFAIARFNCIPFEDFGDPTGVPAKFLPFTPVDYNVGVVAFHRDGIEKVSFQVDGGAVQDVTSMTYNPQSDTWEYWGQIRSSDYGSAQVVRVRAIAYPNGWETASNGKPKLVQAGEGALLEGELPLWVGPNPGDLAPTATLYVSPSGNDSNDGLSPASPKLTVGNAVGNAGEGGVVYCLPGSIQFTPTSSDVTHETQTDRWVTVVSEPGSTKSAVDLVSIGGKINASRIRYMDVNFPSRGHPSRDAHGGSAFYLCMRDISSQGTTTPDSTTIPGETIPQDVIPSDGAGNVISWGLGLQSAARWLDFFYVDSVCSHFAQGFACKGAGWFRNVSLSDTARILWEDVGHCVNCTVDDYIALPNFTGISGSPNPQAEWKFEGRVWAFDQSTVDNSVIYNCQAYAGTRLLFLEDRGQSISNVAIVNTLLEWTTPGDESKMADVEMVSHLVLWNISLVDPQSLSSTGFAFGAVDNISWKNCFVHAANAAPSGGTHSVVGNHYFLGSAFGTDATVGSTYSALFVDSAMRDYRPSPSGVLHGATRTPVITNLVPADINGDEWNVDGSVGAVRGV